MADTYPYTRTINGHDVYIEGPISVITVDDKNYDIVDTAARTDISIIQDKLDSIVDPTGSSAYKDALKDAVIDMLYPVGSLYLSMNDTVPFDHGTWTRVGQGKALVGVGAGPFTAVGDEYGNANAITPSHTHTGSVAGHYHSLSGHTHGTGDSNHPNYPVYRGTGSTEEIGALPNGKWEIWQIAKGGQWAHRAATGGPSKDYTSTVAPGLTINYTGSSATNANYQPSVAVSVWKRTG